jgi:hypothetical protein
MNTANKKITGAMNNINLEKLERVIESNKNELLTFNLSFSYFE